MSNIHIEAFQPLSVYSLATISAPILFTPCKTILNYNHILVRETQNKQKKEHKNKNVEEPRRNVIDYDKRWSQVSLSFRDLVRLLGGGSLWAEIGE